MTKIDNVNQPCSQAILILVFAHAQVYKHNLNSNLWSSVQQHITLIIWPIPLWLQDQHLNYSEIQLPNHPHGHFLVYSQKPQQCMRRQRLFVNCQDVVRIIPNNEQIEHGTNYEKWRYKMDNIIEAWSLDTTFTWYGNKYDNSLTKTLIARTLITNDLSHCIGVYSQNF